MNVFKERDIDNLSAILDFCDRVETLYHQMGESYDTYLMNDLFRDAVLMNIIQIGEAANRLSDDCRDILSDLPWGEIIGTRNIIVHGYAQVDDQIIWNIIENDAPALKAKIEDVIS